MSDERKIGISIPTYNRYQMTIDSFAKVIDDERVESVSIVDDASTDGSCERLVEYFKGNEKVKVYRNKKNLDCYRCKAMSVKYATNEFIILLDSDNTIDKDYLDALYAIPKWEPGTIYQPQFARPHFDFREWRWLTITKSNVAKYSKTHLMTSLNACNHFINRENYLKVFDKSIDPITSDSIYFCYCWLKAGNKIFITPQLEYDHYISPNNDGHYQKFSHLTKNFHEELMNKIRELR